MPTLRPRTISGVVAIPTVEFHVDGVWWVALSFNLGASRTAPGTTPPAVLDREDVIVELFGPGGSLEAIASPDPGPLPVRALRAVQARGDWTFAPGADSPTELRVRIHGQLGTFPLADTFAPSGGGFSDEPQPGDDFPIGSGGGGFLALIRRRFPPPFRKRGCCVKRFEVPLNRDPDATVKSEFFEMQADFSAKPPKRCRCDCCEYRQYVRGEFRREDGQGVKFDLPAGPLDSHTYREDGYIDEFGAGKHGYYGHRATSTPGDSYEAGGCGYRGNETPSCPPAGSLHAEFLGLVVDRCRGKVVATRNWYVNL